MACVCDISEEKSKLEWHRWGHCHAVAEASRKRQSILHHLAADSGVFHEIHARALEQKHCPLPALQEQTKKSAEKLRCEK